MDKRTRHDSVLSTRIQSLYPSGHGVGRQSPQLSSNFFYVEQLRYCMELKRARLGVLANNWILVDLFLDCPFQMGGALDRE